MSSKIIFREKINDDVGYLSVYHDGKIIVEKDGTIQFFRNGKTTTRKIPSTTGRQFYDVDSGNYFLISDGEVFSCNIEHDFEELIDEEIFEGATIVHIKLYDIYIYVLCNLKNELFLGIYNLKEQRLETLQRMHKRSHDVGDSQILVNPFNPKIVCVKIKDFSFGCNSRYYIEIFIRNVHGQWIYNEHYPSSEENPVFLDSFTFASCTSVYNVFDPENYEEIDFSGPMGWRTAATVPIDRRKGMMMTDEGNEINFSLFDFQSGEVVDELTIPSFENSFYVTQYDSSFQICSDGKFYEVYCRGDEKKLRETIELLADKTEDHEIRKMLAIVHDHSLVFEQRK